MIDHLKQMAIFARVVDEGSFRAAAKDIGVAPSGVSQAVSDLEDYLGVILLNRTTRKLSLTNEGRLLYARVSEMMQSAETGLNELNAVSVDPVGALRISVPAFLSASRLADAIAEFAKRHPNVALSISFSDHQMRMIEDGYDMTVRAGWLKDSTMMSRKLGEGQRVLVAGAEYASARAIPESPADLEDWDWIRYKNRPDTTELRSASGVLEKVTGSAQVEVDSIAALHHLATCNLGATVLPYELAEQGIESGHLVHLLEDWSLAPLGYFAVWPNKSRRETLTLVFVRFLADRMGR